MNASIEQRISDRYPLLLAAFQFEAWLPVFFLFFAGYLDLREIIQLEAIYYISVVLLEVPSGYASDRFGRRLTLIASACALICAYTVFGVAAFTGEFSLFVVGQILLATGISFRSGTDTAYHFESLQAQDLQHEFGEREAKALRFSTLVAAVAAFLGGLVAVFHPAWAYALSGLGAVAALALLLSFSDLETSRQNASLTGQLRDCVAYFKNPVLGWLALVSIVFFTLMHVPYEFYQPYLRLLEGHWILAGLPTSVVSGILFAATIVLSGIVAGLSFRGAQRIGLVPWMVLALVLQLLVIAGLAIALHPLLALLVLLRNVPAGLVTAPMNATVAPLVPDTHRATYFSLVSLLGRLGFAATLLVMSSLVGGGTDTDWEALSLLLRTVLIAGVVAVAVVALLGSRFLSGKP